MSDSGGYSALPREELDLSFVVIGLNEDRTLRACLESVRNADLEDLSWELIYVDGGSDDNSVEIARPLADTVVSAETRRRAAENRNIGLRRARGRFVQFLDGDMALAPGWPVAAVGLLEGHPEVAAVFGRLEEHNDSAVYRALQIDWEYPEGPALYCGGAAMFRRSDIARVGGFPEDVAFGEEPLLCWRLRNEHGQGVYHLHETMAQHDLDYGGFADYWKRNARCGRTYAEIAYRCRRGPERFWTTEVGSNLAWGAGLAVLLAALALGPGWWVRGAAGLALAAIWMRKFIQYIRQGKPTPVAALFALHTYAAKLGIAWGILRWTLTGRRGRTG